MCRKTSWGMQPNTRQDGLQIRHPSIIRPRSQFSEISWGRCVIAVPIFDRSILGLQKPQKTTIGVVSEMMAARFHLVARFDVVGRHAYSLEPGAAGRLQRPHLRLAFGVLDFQ